jgi:hypothetical protein
LAGFAKIVSADKMSALLPHVLALGKDPLASVRCKFDFNLSPCGRNSEKHVAFSFKRPMLPNNPTVDQGLDER